MDRREQPGERLLRLRRRHSGDVNGDGYSDVVIGAWAYDNGQDGEGRAYVYHGSVSGLSPLLHGLQRVTRRAPGSQQCRDRGRRQRDGYADVIVGAYNYTTFRLRREGLRLSRFASGLASSPHGQPRSTRLAPISAIPWRPRRRQRRRLRGRRCRAWYYSNGEAQEGGPLSISDRPRPGLLPRWTGRATKRVPTSAIPWGPPATSTATATRTWSSAREL